MSLILAPPPEYAVSGGWALRGALPQGALLAPCQRPDGIPGRAGDDRKGGCPNRLGMTGSPDEPGMTEGYYPAASGSFSHFEAGTESVDYQEYK